MYLREKESLTSKHLDKRVIRAITKTCEIEVTSTMICPNLDPNLTIWYAITMPGEHIFLVT